jgi:hypothetical protein
MIFYKNNRGKANESCGSAAAFFTSFRDVDNSEPDSQKSETTSAADSRTIITFSLNATKNDDKK